MNLALLEKYINQNNCNLDFETDGIGMSWGVSYIRLTVGQKSKFESMEQFFYSTLKSDKNMTSGIYGELAWEERTDIHEWARNLKITDKTNEELIQFIKDSIKDINENLKYWSTTTTINTSFLDVSKKYEKIFLVNEIVSPRHGINTTDMYLTTDENYYYYIEGHWES